jgi:hypothetical protein
MLNFCMFNAFSAAALIPDIITQRNIFYKQHKQAFYPAASYVAADALTAAPFHAFDCFVFGSLIYFMRDLRPHYYPRRRHLCAAENLPPRPPSTFPNMAGAA